MTKATIQTARVAGNSPDQIRAALSQLYPGVAVHTASPALEFELQQQQFGELAVIRLATTTAIRLDLVQRLDGYLLLTAAQGAGLETGKTPSAPLTAMPPSFVLDMQQVGVWRWQPGSYDMVMIDGARLHNRLRHLLERPLVQRVKFHQSIPADAPALQLARALAGAAPGLRRDDARMRACAAELALSLADALAYAVLDDIPHNYSLLLEQRHAGPSPRHVKRAIDYIHANARAVLALDDIARAARVSVRTLQAGFARFQGCSPMQYAKRVRLEGVYSALRGGELEHSVAQIARQWGFSHLGQFAHDYRMAFGETPSETRRTRQGASNDEAFASRGGMPG
ncbi:AraC-like DNA-binding protein [Cupriavidus alkaliphilus]|uniref:helix-turn-helix transcriptional regulator n=1 Tax=Cupriavidus alkaliphilus TaxID=942866 RepID=UPI000DE7063B|nr:AraC family transcriptional regulator [Cupriavidus alkaliphilus]PVY77104.1 AraC-like DNA-binding protein [Cupriavidus alkaliphilus]